MMGLRSFNSLGLEGARSTTRSTRDSVLIARTAWERAVDRGSPDHLVEVKDRSLHACGSVAASGIHNAAKARSETAGHVPFDGDLDLWVAARTRSFQHRSERSKHRFRTAGEYLVCPIREFG